MSRHTPGPWQIEKAPVTGQLCIMSPTAWICGQLSNGNGEIKSETTANARLIAAAPELLDALKGVTRILEAFRSTHQFGKTQTERLEKARAIVAKAEGQKGEP